MKKWTLTSIIATIFIQGCVVIPKQDNVKKENIETSSERCEKVGIKATFINHVYSDFTAEVPIDVNKRWRGLTCSQMLIQILRDIFKISRSLIVC
ncbi:MAG: hypothetical protein B7Y39_17005 [Bdellovibrio sp. 28-41-41]|nr:MAG: hypothetical protein B7Y39_17005 [Bdellovibrio sp. 28-41-41]